MNSSWEVFPNALSALLQYMTLGWPVENCWVNYDSGQVSSRWGLREAAVDGVAKSASWQI